MEETVQLYSCRHSSSLQGDFQKLNEEMNGEGMAPRGSTPHLRLFSQLTIGQVSKDHYFLQATGKVDHKASTKL